MTGPVPSLSSPALPSLAPPRPTTSQRSRRRRAFLAPSPSPSTLLRRPRH